MNYIKWVRQKVGHDRILLNFAGMCIENEAGEILLQRRGDRNEWGFPGGAVELGESVEECAVRELFEETGLIVRADYLIGVYSNYYDEYPNGDLTQSIVHFFKGTAVAGELMADQVETLELKYFKRDQCPVLFNKQNQDCLVDAVNGRRGIYR